MHAPPADRKTADRKTHVLYVEDDADNVRLVERIFQLRPDVDLCVACTGEEGLRVAGEMVPDLVLLDQHLPDMYGDDVVARLRSAVRTADVPVVMVSGDAGRRGPAEICGHGTVEYLRKPFDISELLMIIDSHTA
jgi:DNA-binding response OmpR family regulator